MTIPQRILLHVAIGAALVIAVVTAVTYGIVYDSAKQRDLKHLETYVRERTRREEIGFKQVEINLNLVRGQFLKRMESPLPRNIEGQWNERFELFADGSWRSKTNFSDGHKYSTMWAHKQVVFTPEMKAAILRAQNICDELLPGWADEFPSVYFVLPGWLNIGFDPRIPAWVWDTPADYNATNLEWFALAMPAEKPTDRFGWTGVIEEPTTKVPIVSAYLPIFKDGHFLGSLGHDKYVNRMMDEITHSDLPGARHVIFRADGRIIAHPTKLNEILASKGLLQMQNSGESDLASLFRAVMSRPERQFSDYDNGSGCYFSVARLSGPEWFFLTTMPRELLQRQAFQSAQWVLWSGLVSLALVLAFLAVILRRQVSRPLAELSRATKQMSGGDISARAAVNRRDELGALAESFNEMASRVALRDAELRKLNEDLEQRVTLRTSELSEANRSLAEAREDALRLLARERELNELKSSFVSLVSHEFRTPLEIIMSSVDNLHRYHDRLPPVKREQLLLTINKSVRRMSDMMEEVLVLGRLETDRVTFHPTPLEFRALCRRLCDEIESATNGRCPIHLELDGAPEHASGDESLLRHIFTNLLANAVKYSPPGQPVNFRIQRNANAAVCEIADRGCGIPAADQKQLFQAFHRGSNVRQIPGTGLGLLIVGRCVTLHGGKIQFQSDEGAGTTFTVSLPLFNDIANADSKL